MLKKLPELVVEARKGLNVLTAQEAREKRNAIGGIILDVRETEEFNKHSVKDVVHIPRGVLEGKMLTTYGDETMPIFIHCAGGVRATFAAEQLVKLGYKQVWVISCKVDEVIKSFT
ncbi:rhodanese-like domain-containing protein [Thalassotalea sp. M1531]|uniref:Rhodanese-like domain-containing protein n=1 Tax=Thalassotalea algicola TaxID=2716224 RepID=A0A7Y0LFP5_9GAMM|nr:rhodanese-like domain-containing protein [Thalassotalea algicola]NMP32335.1 rhodanese-like domain-containing protein [Thalassotalea algicola]